MGLFVAQAGGLGPPMFRRTLIHCHYGLSYALVYALWTHVAQSVGASSLVNYIASYVVFTVGLESSIVLFQNFDVRRAFSRAWLVAV